MTARPPIDGRTPPCQVLAGGRLCERTDDRPTVLHALLGIICRDHRLVLMPVPKEVAQ